MDENLIKYLDKNYKLKLTDTPQILLEGLKSIKQGLREVDGLSIGKPMRVQYTITHFNEHSNGESS